MQELTLKPVLKPRKKYLERSSLLPIFQVCCQTWLGQQTTSISESRQATSKDLVIRKGAKHIATKRSEDYFMFTAVVQLRDSLFCSSVPSLLWFPQLLSLQTLGYLTTSVYSQNLAGGRNTNSNTVVFVGCNVSPAYINWHKRRGLWPIKWILKTSAELKILSY